MNLTTNSHRIFIHLTGKLRFHYDNDNEYDNEILGADVIISCVLPGFIFVIVVVDDEMEATSSSSRCLEKRNELEQQRYLIVVLVLVVVVVVKSP